MFWLLTVLIAWFSRLSCPQIAWFYPPRPTVSVSSKHQWAAKLWKPDANLLWSFEKLSRESMASSRTSSASTPPPSYRETLILGSSSCRAGVSSSPPPPPTNPEVEVQGGGRKQWMKDWKSWITKSGLLIVTLVIIIALQFFYYWKQGVSFGRICIWAEVWSL